MASSFSYRNFDIPLDEIDRIEVIRGSGGTIYGANSATGVVNIFTKTPERGINARVEQAAPGYTMASLRAGTEVGDNSAISGYLKFRYFGGFDSYAGKNEDGEPLGFTSRFTEEYDKSTMYVAGLKGKFSIGNNAELSFNSHFNALDKIDYTNTYEGGSLDLVSQALTSDNLYVHDGFSYRSVNSVRYDQNFSDDHTLFVRLSSNLENTYEKLGGGFTANNSFYDLELQDNITLGAFNELSFGANFRLVNLDISEINSVSTINYQNAQSNETLKGAFVQNKFRMLNDKLNLTLGIKTENFSLVNDKFYFSPMAKIAFSPSNNLTLWGGFTQSFTTPGLNNTNGEMFLFQTPSVEAWNTAAEAGVYQEFYNQYYDEAIASGEDPTTAEQTALVRINNFFNSEFGQQTVQFVTDLLVEENPSFAVENGSNTEPTKYQSFELGLRAGLANNLSFESNFFYNLIDDAIIAPTVTSTTVFKESNTQPGRFASYYFFGNYVKGTSIGSESMLRYKPLSNISLELSHTWLKSEWEYQENNEFDIYNPNVVDPSDLDQTPDVPYVPEHVFRLSGNIDLPNSFTFSLNAIHTSRFNTQAEYRFSDERYENLITPDLEVTPSSIIAKNGSRTIVSLRLEKRFIEDRLSIYAFGNDLFNNGMIANTNQITNVTISQIARMYGVGLNYKLN